MVVCKSTQAVAAQQWCTGYHTFVSIVCNPFLNPGVQHSGAGLASCRRMHATKAVLMHATRKEQTACPQVMLATPPDSFRVHECRLSSWLHAAAHPKMSVQNDCANVTTSTAAIPVKQPSSMSPCMLKVLHDMFCAAASVTQRTCVVPGTGTLGFKTTLFLL